MPEQRKTTPKQDLVIRALVLKGFTSPTWILTYLEEKGILKPGHEIDEKIIARRIKEYRPRDASGPWSAIDDVPGDAGGILRVAQWLHDSTEGRVWLSLGLARLVGRICASADMPPNWAWAFARAYQAARTRKVRDMRCLDLALMARVWEPPPGVHPVAYYPERHSVGMTCQQIGESSQWLDLMFGQAALEKDLSGLTFDLPDYADDNVEDVETNAE